MTNYDSKPSILEAKGNGSYFYRWDIKEISREQEGNLVKSYDCEEVTIWSPLNKDKVKLAVINYMWGNNHEQKLINEYNSAKLGLFNEEENAVKIKAYEDFLRKRVEIKQMVDDDFKELGL
ncbi:MAG: hypothetical protein WCQ63_04520 [Methanomethylophilus sp.]